MGSIAGTSVRKPHTIFSLADWRAWPDNERWELIDGLAYNMSPAPRTVHQKAALHLASRLEQALEGKPCQPFIAPVDVFLRADEASEGDTVVQPDVLVVCDPGTVHDDGIYGAPDFVAEILSDSTAFKDLGVKKTGLRSRRGTRVLADPSRNPQRERVPPARRAI